jgi:HK97 family phage portal protein
MAVIVSFGQVVSMSAPRNSQAPVYAPAGVGLYGSSFATYAAIWRTQPNVRTVVDFLARNIASLPLHWFRRKSDTDRERLAGHGLATLLSNPNPAKSGYRFFEDLMSDLGIYFNAFWVKVRTNGQVTGLVRVPPEQMAIEGTLLPQRYVWTPPGSESQFFAPSEIVNFNGYNPDSQTALLGVSPLETLRRILAEEAAASEYRQHFWQNSARIEGVVTRPREAPRWNQQQVTDFRTQWNDTFTGGGNSGKTAILTDGMDFKPVSFSARDSEFTAARKLTREECAAAYHIPLPMVGILDHATYSNIREQHKQLYQDCLGPWLTMLEDELQRQLLYDFDDVKNVYCEYNIAEKLKGSFEEQAVALNTLVGRPVMTMNEGRARLNLPASDASDADEVALPLNMDGTGTGGGTPAPPADAPPVGYATMPVIRATWERQQRRLDGVPREARAETFAGQLSRWNAELAADLLPVYLAAGFDEAEAVRRSADVAADANAATLRSLQQESAHHAA